jgi:SOS-response transcriptional repressor LexA
MESFSPHGRESAEGAGMRKSSTRHYDVLEAIKAWKAVKGYSPSIRNLMDMTGISSTSLIVLYLDKLQDERLIRRDKYISRSIELAGSQNLTSVSEHYKRIAQSISDEHMDGRKNLSAEVIARRTEAVRAARHNKCRKATEAENIEKAVRYAQEHDAMEVGHHPRPWSLIHATKIG